MSRREITFGWQRGQLISLALLSLIVSSVAVFLCNAPMVPFADPARLRC